MNLPERSKMLDLEEYVLVTQRLIQMPDLNFSGRLFGGTVMAWIDEAAAMAAIQTIGSKKLVTKKISEIVFHTPGLPGDLLEFWCKATHLGNTSITFHCCVVVRDESDHSTRDLCEASIVYVAIDEHGKGRSWRKQRDDRK